VLARTLRQVAVDLLSEVRRLDRRITEAAATLSAAVVASGTTLTDLHGIGDVVAVKILDGAGASAAGEPAAAPGERRQPAARALGDLLALTYGPAAVLSERLATVKGVDEAYVYGSWAARYAGARPDGAVLIASRPHRVGGGRQGVVNGRASSSAFELVQQSGTQQVLVL
jgi:hypothetical protein